MARPEEKRERLDEIRAALASQECEGRDAIVAKLARHDACHAYDGRFRGHIMHETRRSLGHCA